MTRFFSLACILALSPAVCAAAPAVSAIAYHPTGSIVACGTYGEVRLFDTAKGTAIRTLGGQTGRVTALSFSPDGSRLAIASGEPSQAGIVRLYPFANPAAAPVTLAHPDVLYALAFSPDGKLLATAGYDRTIRVFELGNAKNGTITPSHTLKDHSDAIYALAFHPDGQLLASASADRAVKVWDSATGTRLFTLSDSTDWVYTLAWSPDKTHLAAAGIDKSIRIWEANRAGGKLVQSVFAHEKPVWRIAYATDGKTLFSAGEDRVIKAWDSVKMVESRVFPAQPETILAFAIRADGKQLAVGRFDGVAELLDAANGKRTAQLLPAKPVVPKPAKLTPNAGVRGTTTRVRVTGQHLDAVTAITASMPDARVKMIGMKDADLEIDLSLPANAPAGALKLILAGEAGKAAPLTFALDRYPGIPEAGFTESARRAMPITMPATVVGTIDRAGDVDYFRFEANAGQQVGVQVVAAELGSKLDPELVLTDLDGSVLAEGNGGLLGHTFTQAGTFAIGIRDRDFRGGPDMTYRLHIGDIPIVTGVFPLGVQRGTSATVHLEGVNLSAAGPLTLNVSPPIEAMPGSRHALTIPSTARGERPLGQAFVVVDQFPAVVIDPQGGADLRVPGSADGILMKPGEAQQARFAAKKGEPLIIEVNARRAGSPVDPVIEILDAAGNPVPRAVLRCTAKTFTVFRDHDSAVPGIRLEYWNELAINDYLYVDGELMRIFALPRNPDDDCQFYQVEGKRVGFLDTTPTHHSLGSPMYKVEFHPPGSTFPPNGLPVFTLVYRNDDGGAGYGKDSQLFFEAPTDGVYQVRIRDARHAGGPTNAYRLTVRPPRPDFTVSLAPRSFAVWKGGAVPVSVTATRIDGYDGPIRVQLKGLPAGFQAPVTFIEAGQTTTAFALHSRSDANVPPNTKVKLVATARIGGKDVVHEVPVGLPTLAEPGDITTTTRQDTIHITPGQETRFTVDVERRGDFKGRIPLEVRGLPYGVRVLNIGLNGILITERDTSREIVIYAEPWVEAMDRPLVIVARSERKKTEHASKSVLLKVEK